MSSAVPLHARVDAAISTMLTALMELIMEAMKFITLAVRRAEILHRHEVQGVTVTGYGKQSKGNLDVWGDSNHAL